MKILKLLVGVSVVSFVAFFIGYFSAKFYIAPPSTSADCAAWAGAMGTIAAFFSAVWLATAAERKNSRQEHARAVIAGASIMPSIELMCDALELVEVMLTAGVTVSNSDFSAELMRILSVPAAWDQDDLLPLIPIPENVAASLARASSTYSQVLAQAQAIARFENGTNSDLTLMFQTLLPEPLGKVHTRLKNARTVILRFVDAAEPPL
ncbi:hypothetical protein KW842_01875 [Duganella sp. sic0402]|uniref:hypothetical protein n=1 Tax=Duganella sp. sic0402 TaxID=2854786 RepID=UPI001C44BDEA|nr:hypothetical protein [Duganella sp. sic0402]MBV7534505.1 hypothetical protein [Duganella sp. sic0402]